MCYTTNIIKTFRLLYLNVVKTNKFKKLFALNRIICIFAVLVLHPRSNGTVNCVDMDSVRLTVQTVLSLEPVTYHIHTAFTVLHQSQDAVQIQCASGWYLKDAIDNFCKLFFTERNQICLTRPFLPQVVEEYDNQ